MPFFNHKTINSIAMSFGCDTEMNVTVETAVMVVIGVMNVIRRDGCDR